MTSACTRVKQISLALTDVKKLGVSEQEKEVARPSSKRTHIIIATEQVMTSFASNPFSKYRSLFPTLFDISGIEIAEGRYIFMFVEFFPGQAHIEITF